MTTRRLTMAQAVVEFLKNQYVSRDGVEHRLVHGVFGIFGHGNVAGFGQALEEYGGKDLVYHQPKNEQAMVHTAIAFAKARRGLGTFACTTSVGPGATNMVTGAATATINRLPVLLLPGDIFANRKPAPVLQQLECFSNPDMSVNDAFKPVSRFWDRINRPEQILHSLPEAMRYLADPTLMGAVTICLPEDVQAESYDYPENFFEKRVYRVSRTAVDTEALKDAVTLIQNSQKPMIIAGGGVLYSQAETALQVFCEKTKIPVVVTQAGKSVLSEKHPQCLGALGVTGTSAAHQIATDCDLVIGLGTRYSDFTTASQTQFQNSKVKFININLQSFDAAKQGALSLIGDAKHVLEQLILALQDYRISTQYEQTVASAKELWVAQLEKITHPMGAQRKLHQSEVIRVFNETVGANATIVHAAGGLPGDLHKLWISKSPGDYHSEYGYSCMGYEIAGALGVKMADPSRDVYAVLGDGSYLMMNHEIITSIQEKKKIMVLLLDNHGYQCIHNLQKSCGTKSFGNEFRERNPENHRLEGQTLKVDFVANAQSLGAKTFVAENEKSLKEALVSAQQESKTCLIYVEIEAGTPLPGFAWWDVPVAEVSTDTQVKEKRTQYDSKIQSQKFYY